MQAKHAESIDALRSGADVVFQAAFFDGQFHGRSDFLVRQADGSYAVFDTKLARHAKVTALLQLAAYGDQLLKAGITPDPAVTLVLGATVPLPGGGFDYVRSHHKLADILPVFRERRDRFLALTASHLAQPGRSAVGCCRNHRLRPLRLLPGAGHGHRRPPPGGPDELGTAQEAARAMASTRSRTWPRQPCRSANASLLRLQDQARMQSGIGGDGRRRPVRQGRRRAQHPLRGSFRKTPWPNFPRPATATSSSTSRAIRCGRNSATGVWGLEYLFGVIEAPTGPGVPGVFRPFWAHSREAEKQAFLDFLDYVEKRRQDYPDMHVYHYAAYEKTALRKLSVMHVAGEDTVDGWLRDGLLVDLYQTVRNSIRISENSYSIKKLEPLYMGDESALRGREGRRRLGGCLRPLLRRPRR